MVSILITGSNRGLGKALCQFFINNGLQVISHSRTEQSYQNFGQALNVVGDLSNEEVAFKISQQVTEAGFELKTLICNAGKSKSAITGQETKTDWNKSLNDNFFSAVNIIKAFENSLSKSSGKIICIGSICGSSVIPGAPITYSCSKSLLMSFVQHYSKFLARKGIHLNMVELGNVLFSDGTWDLKLKSNPEAVQKMLSECVPLQRLGEPSDILGLIEWLISDECQFATGSIFRVDGGQL